MSSTVITVVEHQNIPKLSSSRDTDALFSLCQGAEGEDAGILTVRATPAGAVFRTRGFVGVIVLPSGTVLEILPKTSVLSDEQNVSGARSTLLALILNWYKLARGLELGGSHALASNTPLLEQLMQLYIIELNTLLRRGMRSGFRSHREKRQSVRGRIVWNEQLRGFRGVTDGLVCEYDEFSADRPENRLLRWSVEQLRGWTTNPELRSTLSEMYDRLAHVPTSSVPREDFRRWSQDRNLNYYRHVKPWIALIIEMTSPTGVLGDQSMPALVFPCEKLFERWVETYLQSAVSGTELTLKRQSTEHYLTTFQNKNWFQLKPDFVLVANGETTVVIDAKWKLLRASLHSGTEKYGISQADLYQMQAYLVAYGCERGVLVYPHHPDFPQLLDEEEFFLAEGRSVAVRSIEIGNRQSCEVVPLPLPFSFPYFV